MDLAAVEDGSRTNEQTIQLNKNILTPQPEYFRATLKGNFLDAQNGSIHLEKSGPHLFSYVDYLSTGLVTIEPKSDVPHRIPNSSPANLNHSLGHNGDRDTPIGISKLPSDLMEQPLTIPEPERTSNSSTVYSRRLKMDQ